MTITARICGAAIGAFCLVGLANAALAGSVTPPGERVGFDIASPLPEGVYFIDIATLGNYRDGPKNGNSLLAFNVPAVVWSTPWTILGGNVRFGAAAPELSLSFNHVDHSPVGGPAALGHGGAVSTMYNPVIAGTIAWSLGNGFSLSTSVGAYLPITTGDAGNFINRTTITEVLGLSYHNAGWNLTANLYAGENLDQNSCSPIPAGVSALVPFGTTCANNSWFNYDLAATHTFGRWEFGVVGFGSTDFDVPNKPNITAIGGLTYPNTQAQFAVGGLMGYNFGVLIMQLVVATDVWTQNYNAKETEGLLRVVVPVWRPEQQKVIAAKY
jgi:hypothetical protein